MISYEQFVIILLLFKSSFLFVWLFSLQAQSVLGTTPELIEISSLIEGEWRDVNDSFDNSIVRIDYSFYAIVTCRDVIYHNVMFWNFCDLNMLQIR